MTFKAVHVSPSFPAPADDTRVDRLGGVPAAVARVRQVSLRRRPAVELGLAVGADLGEVGGRALHEGVRVEMAGERPRAAGDGLVAVGAPTRLGLACVYLPDQLSQACSLHNHTNFVKDNLNRL